MKLARGYTSTAAIAAALPVALAIVFASRDLTTAALVSGGVAVFLILFIAYFFRDPERNPPHDPDAVVSGADGVVSLITDVTHPLVEGPHTRISIFLNVFDVHVNRCPVAGTIRSLAYVPGRKVFAFLDEASEVNEHSTILIETPRFRCLVKQIVGPVARRVFYWLSEGQSVQQGDRLGMMKFGSRMDVYLPKGRFDLLVSKGQRVVAGETVMARWKAMS